MGDNDQGSEIGYYLTVLSGGLVLLLTFIANLIWGTADATITSAVLWMFLT